MKTLKNYLQDLNSEPKLGNDDIVENGTMRPLKKYAQVDLTGAEGLYETNVDRWSRNAKHQFAKSELEAANDQIEFEKGDIVLYEGNEVLVKIPAGPKKTVGIMLDNHLKLVHQSKLTKLDEMVMGNLKNITPINRIMQLAGLEHSGSIEHITEDKILTETDAESMLTQLVNTAQNMAQYKNNPDAVKLYVIGTVLSQIAKDINNNKFQTPAALAKMTELQTLGPMGNDLINAANNMTQTQPAQGQNSQNQQSQTSPTTNSTQGQ